MRAEVFTPEGECIRIDRYSQHSIDDNGVLSVYILVSEYTGELFAVFARGHWTRIMFSKTP